MPRPARSSGDDRLYHGIASGDPHKLEPTEQEPVPGCWRRFARGPQLMEDLMTRQQALFWWVVGSVVLMVVGSFGPWAKVLAFTVSGTDGSNDGWFVVAIAVVAGAVFLWKRETTRAGFAAIVGGVLGASVAIYDRSNLKDVASEGGELGELVQVGWGLNLAMVASISLAIAGAAWILKFEEEPTEASQSVEPVEPTAPTEPV
jgi:hypothetical protein